MMGREFIDIYSIQELGETICCVYISIKYEVNKAIQFMKWKGFRGDLLYDMNGFLVFYQEERFVPSMTVEDNFYRIITEDNIWENLPNSDLVTYKCRVITDGIICVSYLPNTINAEVDGIPG